MKKPVPFRMEWDAHEHEHKERSSDWFWAMGVMTISVAVVSVILGNIIFAIFLLTAVFALALFINKVPDNVHVIVDERGITRDKIHYPYATLASFWIDADHSHPKILLGSEKLFMPLIVMPLDVSINLEELAENLSSHLSEKYHSLPFVEKVIEYLGF